MVDIGGLCPRRSFPTLYVLYRQYLYVLYYVRCSFENLARHGATASSEAQSSAVIHQREASASPSPRLLAVNLILELALGGAWTGGWRADDRRALAESLEDAEKRQEVVEQLKQQTAQ